jgi:valyl-tRNA synthetase
MENIRDWNISRQLWWGQRIPAYYFGKGKEDYVVAQNENLALEKARLKSGNDSLELKDLCQDEDVLDTWFSSWLWPISVFDGIRNPQNKEIEYYYPTQDLVTGPDILFFWVARMIISGYAFRDEKPFSKVYLTGLVRDKKGRKMSKQLGNSPDALKLIDDYGADAVRVGLMLSSAAGNDILFDETLCQQGKNFANKIWNAYRLIEGWEIKEDLPQPKVANEALQWYANHFEKTLGWVDENFEKYRISDALMSIYKLLWDDFCSWLLELVKPDYGQPVDQQTYTEIIALFEKNLRILHPFMPFLTEELWHFIKDRKTDEALTISAWPKTKKFDQKLIADFELAQQIIVGIRNFRNEKNISYKESISLYINTEATDFSFESSIVKLGGLTAINFTSPPEELVGGSFRINNLELFIPTDAAEDPEAEKEKLTLELNYTRGFLASVEKKLSNERFVANAPEKVIALERKKAADAKEKIVLLEKNLALL